MIFPHISRFFSASLLFGMGALLSLNAYLWSKQATNSYQLNVLKTPWSPAMHEQLAKQYNLEGRTEQAVGELKLAQVLGASTYADQITQWESERAQKEAALGFWQTVAKKYPDYRDAYISLASLSYELGQFDNYRKYLSRAEALDPYAPSLLHLKQL